MCCCCWCCCCFAVALLLLLLLLVLFLLLLLLSLLWLVPEVWEAPSAASTDWPGRAGLGAYWLKVSSLPFRASGPEALEGFITLSQKPRMNSLSTAPSFFKRAPEGLAQGLLFGSLMGFR